jgi:hypothetical protein
MVLTLLLATRPGCGVSGCTGAVRAARVLQKHICGPCPTSLLLTPRIIAIRWRFSPQETETPLTELNCFLYCALGLVCVCVAVLTGTSATRPISPHTSSPRFTTLTHYSNIISH